jgi:hypothetical protein
MFLTSPRNSAVAHQSLLKKLGCTTLICPTPRPAPVNVILEACSLNVLEVLSVDELMSTQYPDFLFSKTWPDAATETLVVLYANHGNSLYIPCYQLLTSMYVATHPGRLEFQSQSSGLMTPHASTWRW